MENISLEFEEIREEWKDSKDMHATSIPAVTTIITLTTTLKDNGGTDSVEHAGGDNFTAWDEYLDLNGGALQY